MKNFPFINDLAGVIKETSKKESEAAVKFPVLGTIDGEHNLLLDGFSRPIPIRDYLVWEPITNLYLQATTENDVRIELNIEPNSRVLCLPIEDGHTFVVMGQVK